MIEMNASDDRSVAAFRTALEAATQMRPMLGADPRPNCLVIDEIDGAPAVSEAGTHNRSTLTNIWAVIRVVMWASRAYIYNP